MSTKANSPPFLIVIIISAGYDFGDLHSNTSDSPPGYIKHLTLSLLCAMLWNTGRSPDTRQSLLQGARREQ